MFVCSIVVVDKLYFFRYNYINDLELGFFVKFLIRIARPPLLVGWYKNNKIKFF